MYWILSYALLCKELGVEAHRALASARNPENTIGKESFKKESRYLPWVPMAGEEVKSRAFASLVLAQAAKQHQSMSLAIYFLFMILDHLKTLPSLIGWPPDTSLPRIALKPLISLNSRLPLEASGITRTTLSTRLIFPRRIHTSLWTNRSGALSQIEIASKKANKRLPSCHQCMSVWRPTFHIVS